jgi:hypothetical protein
MVKNKYSLHIHSNLDVSQSYRPPQTETRIALIFLAKLSLLESLSSSVAKQPFLIHSLLQEFLSDLYSPAEN